MTKQLPAKSRKANGAKPPRRRNKKAPELPEKTQKLILKGFRLAYEEHHPKSS